MTGAQHGLPCCMNVLREGVRSHFVSKVAERLGDCDELLAGGGRAGWARRVSSA